MKLKKTRQEMRWGQSWLADRLGVSIQTIGNWEHEKTPIPNMAILAVKFLIEEERKKWVV